MRNLVANRYYAFSWHLLASAIIALLSALLVFLLWYPGALAYASGVVEIYLMLLAVDVVLGPLITLIIFDRKKKELKRDLIIVVNLQFIALMYGLYAVCVARPVYIVFNTDRFDLVRANDITEEKLKKVTRPEYRSLPLFGPKVIAARRPDDAKSRNELLFNSLSGGDDLPHIPQYYVPYNEEISDIAQRIRPLQNLKEFNGEKLSAVDDLLKKYTLAKIKAGYLPLRGKAKDGVVIVRYDSGQILETVDLMPWK